MTRIEKKEESGILAYFKGFHGRHLKEGRANGTAPRLNLPLRVSGHLPQGGELQ